MHMLFNYFLLNIHPLLIGVYSSRIKEQTPQKIGREIGIGIENMFKKNWTTSLISLTTPYSTNDLCILHLEVNKHALPITTIHSRKVRFWSMLHHRLAKTTRSLGVFSIQLVGELENMGSEAKNAHVPYIGSQIVL